MTGREDQQISIWKSLSILDWVAVGLCAVGVLALWAGSTFKGQRGMGLLQSVGVVAAFYLLYRFWNGWRSQLLWSLRNRLIVAYLFIAVVPILLLLILASLLGQIIYSQLGAYLLYHEVADRLEMLASSSEAIAAAE